MNADIKSVKKLAADKLRGCWGDEIMVFLLNAAVMVLCTGVFLTVYACFLRSGIISGDIGNAVSESPVFAGIAVLVGILAYTVSAPAYIGSCWWTIHYVRDDSRDVKCLLCCYSSPKVFFRSVQMKLASDIPCTLLMGAVIGVYFLCDMLISPLDGVGYVIAAVFKWLITLAALLAVFGLILRFAAVPYIYCLNHDDSCIENIRHCFRLTRENKQLLRDTAAVFIRIIPVIAIVISCIFIFPYCATLFAAVCLKMSESENIPEKADENDVKDD